MKKFLSNSLFSSPLFFNLFFCLLLAGLPVAVQAAEEEPASEPSPELTDVVVADETADETPVDALVSEESESDAPLPAEEDEALIASLLQQLTEASLRETGDVLDQLEQAGGRDMLPLFQSMLEGNLYYDEESLELINISKSEQGEDVGNPVFDSEAMVDLESIETKKIRVNNSLRSSLRSSIARVLLMEGTRSERKAAIRNMLTDIDDDSVVLMEQARREETDSSVMSLLDVGIAMHTVQTETALEPRLEALDILDGRLETPVRNLLNRYLDDSVIEEQDPAFTAKVQEVMTGIDSKIKFYDFIEQLFFGMSLGSVLLLVAIGLAVTFGVMGVINMAHGEMLMLGAYTTFVMQQIMPNSISTSIWLSIPAAFVVSGCVGILIQRLVIRHLNGRPLETLLATFGISLILQQAVRTIFSPLNKRVISPEWMSGSWEINPAFSVTYNRLYILIFAIIVFFILQFILKKTSLGLNVRAVSQNRNMAKSMGIRTDRVDAMTFGLGSGIAGIAGVALSQLTNVGPNLGQSYIIDSFMVVVFGGVGNLLGTLVGAFSLGITNKFLEPVTGTVLANILVLVFIILFIQKRPKGMFPQKGRAAD